MSEQDGFLVPPAVTEGIMQVLGEMIAASDAWYDSHLETVKPAWHVRARWKLNQTVTAWRDRAARRAYKIIAGDWPDDRPDDWD